MNLNFTSEIRDCLDPFSSPMASINCSSKICNESVQFQMDIRKFNRRGSRFQGNAEVGAFHVVVLQRTAKKYTEIYNARAQLLFWGRFLKGGINYTRYNSYSRDKSAILGITIPGIKMGSWKHYLSLE